MLQSKPDNSTSASKKSNEYSGHILVVDDEKKNRIFLKDVLEAKGYHVSEAEDGKQALHRAMNDPPDVILLDVMMPGMDGFEVCRRLKKDPKTASIPILMVTALSERSDRIKGIEAGANDFLSKPLDYHEAVLRVHNAVYSKHLFDQLQEDFERLKELESLRDNLTHMIIHDLRQPITVISGYFQLLQLHAGDSTTDSTTERKRDVFEQISRAVNVLMEMIESLLDVTRLEAGKMPLNLSHCDLNELVEEVVETLGPLKDKHNVHIKSSDDPVSAFCDKDLIRRVIANLVGNAMKYTPKGGEVRITVESDKLQSRIAVSDTGAGIPKEYHDKIFDKFGQVKSRQAGTKYSTGLGLTFCKLAVEAHGGEIGVESESGKGSTFWFLLPSVSD